MAERLTFEDRVVVVTGAGNGIGRSYANAFARRGAKVVVNDFGGAVDGTGRDTKSADRVVQEIETEGGIAVANHDSVVEGEKVVQTALDTWGRVDVLINNAGIAYATPFEEMDRDAWDRMIDVHLNGSHACTAAAWPHMQREGFGRLLFTSSPFGLHSAAKFAHYSAAKAAVIGLARTLSLEGAAHDIHANVVAPYSASRMTGVSDEKQVTSQIGPRYLAQLVVWLCHASTTENGSIFEVGGGLVHKVRWALGRRLELFGDDHTAENIAANAATLDDFGDALHPETGDAHTIGKALTGGDPSKLFSDDPETSGEDA
ncbi:MAG: SDR family NAD(P)-dependent oxidoreductase [Myxococcota bacterium]